MTPGMWAVFAALSTLAVGGAVVTITRNNLVSAVMSLVLSFFGVAGLYALMSAHFLAAVQVLVYAGGIMVLFIFVVMVLNRDENEGWLRTGLLGKTLLVGGVLFLLIRWAVVLYRVASGVAPGPEMPASTGTVKQTGLFLLTEYLFPFEAVSVLLLIAVVAAVVIARGHAAQPTSAYEQESEPMAAMPPDPSPATEEVHA